MFGKYADKNPALKDIVASYDLTCEELQRILIKDEFPMHCLFDKYSRVYAYFDDWAVVKTKEARITRFIVRPKQEKETRIETIDWE